MNVRSPSPAIFAVLSVLLLCLLLAPVVSAVTPTTVKTTATAPPILQACSHAKVPEARFSCGFLKNQSYLIPDGPPYIIECIDNSSSEPDQPLVEWFWEFGDGGTSTSRNPKHAYSEARLYNINLTVTTWCGKKYSNTSYGDISIYCSVPVPEFTTNVTEGYAPLAVSVTDLSQNTPEDVTTWTYWFDNSRFSHKRNPVFVYTTPGTYTINQTVWKDCVQMSSTLHPPVVHQIIVRSLLSPVSEVNETVTSPAPALTRPVPVSPAPGISGAVTETPLSIPASPGTGMLSVATEPAGVQLFVDGVLRGTSPATVADLAAGTHSLRLEREGYHNMTVPVLINTGQTNTFSTTLMPVDSGGIAILPVIALAIIMLSVIGAGIFLFRQQKKE
jgi:PKD repeat protein